MRPVDYAALTTRRCSTCREIKPVSAFGKYNDATAVLTGWRYYSRCLDCARAAARDYGTANRERRNARLTAWRRSNPDVALANEQRKRVRSKYGITLTQRNEIYERQGWRCAICGDLTSLVLDHNHETGAIRGGLCNPCNVRLGVIEASSDPEVTAKRIEPDHWRAALLHISADVLLNPTHTPAPAGVSAAPTSRDRPIGPAGAPIPTTSEEQCERCGRILDCCRHCPVHEGDVDE